MGRARLLLLFLLVLGSGQALDQLDVFEAIPTQIEEPPSGQEGKEDSDETDDDDGVVSLPPSGYDVDYVVNRPGHSPGEDDEDDEGDGCGDIEEEGEVMCRRKGKELTPYKKYKAYKTWIRRPLFVIIIGGLRWDYLQGEGGKEFKAFDWIKKHGTTMRQVVPVFPPLDLPTWTSLATGLYPTHTGVIGDHMYNLKTRQLFSRGSSASQTTLDQWWVGGEPIWSLAAKHGRKVSVLNWHDCSLPGRNIENPKDCRPFNSSGSVRSKKIMVQMFNKAITKIHKDDYDLSIVYTDSLKRTAQRFGPNSDEVKEELANLDEILQGRLSDIKNKKERADLKLNILLVSDYGLNGINRTTKVVLDEFLDFDHVQFIINRGGSTVLVPYALRAGDIMRGVGTKKGVANMIGINAYVRDVNLEVPQLDYPEIPPELHYAGQPWTQDILLVAKPGFEIKIEEDSPKCLPPLSDIEGTSAYHPQPPPPHIVPGRDKHKSKELRAREKVEVALFNDFAHTMKTIGFAWGPDFKSGYESDPIEIVDLYQVMAFLLKIPPNPHDGDWSRIRPMLKISSACSFSPSLLLLLLPLTTWLLTLE
jgi:ectonucleotide pyrophosphatase/phosphodiesterase family protein 5